MGMEVKTGGKKGKKGKKVTIVSTGDI